MKRLAAALLWTSLFLVLLAGADQFFLRGSTTVPVLSEVRVFYLDFRQRLLSLAGRESDDTLDSVIRRNSERRPDRIGPEEGSPHYLYVDSKGELQFADALEEIPLKYRKEAQPLSR